MTPVGVGIVGCGFVSTSYGDALPYHSELNLIGVHDRDDARADAFAARYGGNSYRTLDALLADPTIEIILNLTNPRSHAELTRAALQAGKHVYSEKPLGMTSAEAESLVIMARERGRILAVAPCSVLSETADTVAAAIEDCAIGTPRLVYAEFEDGMIAPRDVPWTWQNALGAPWPAKDEFEIGCTYEHAGYVLTWLIRFFGPVRAVTSFASCRLPDKGIAVDSIAPDFTVGCLEHASGVVSRVTCGLVAPRDKSITVIGDTGVLKVRDVRHERCPVQVRRYSPGRITAGIERRVAALFARLGRPVPAEGWAAWRNYRYKGNPPAWLSGPKAVDFLRGPAEMAAELRGKGQCRLTPEFGWHIVEVLEALQYPEGISSRVMRSATALDSVNGGQFGGF